jgi:hypothetical protein
VFNQSTTHTGKLDLVTVIHGLLKDGATIDTGFVGASEIHHRQGLAGANELCMKMTHEVVV